MKFRGERAGGLKIQNKVTLLKNAFVVPLTVLYCAGDCGVRLHQRSRQDLVGRSHCEMDW